MISICVPINDSDKELLSTLDSNNSSLKREMGVENIVGDLEVVLQGE